MLVLFSCFAETSAQPCLVAVCECVSVCERVLAEDYTVLMSRISRPTCWESLKLQEASTQAYYQQQEVFN